MTTDVNTFITPVVEKLCEVLQLQDSMSDVYAPLTDDPVVRASCIAALGQLQSHCNRTFLRGTYVERYYDQNTVIRLREFPIGDIADITSVRLIHKVNFYRLHDPNAETVLVSGDDFNLLQNSVLQLLSVPNSTSVYDPVALAFVTGADIESVSDNCRANFEIEYLGGYQLASDHDLLFNALVQQGLTLYNRKNSSGIAQVTGTDRQSVRMDAYDLDAGNVLETVQTIISPLVYYGNAEKINVPPSSAP